MAATAGLKIERAINIDRKIVMSPKNPTAGLKTLLNNNNNGFFLFDKFSQQDINKHTINKKWDAD